MPSPRPERAPARVWSAALSYTLAGAIGIWAALAAFPRRDLLGRLPPGLPAGADGLQHIAGQLYFLAEPWHWPLLMVHRLDGPHGVNIGLTDSIPLVAVLLKLLHPILPGVQQGIGPWLGLAWILQPVAAVYALRGTGERGLAACLAAAAIASAMPSFLLRFGHEALDGHFLLLVALGLYLRATAPAAGRGPMAGLALLVVLALFVHPYLMAMVAAVAVAVPATLAARATMGSGGGGHAWRRAARAGAGVLAALVVTAALAKLFGYLGGGGLPGDYGRYAMNLAAPVWPALSRLAPRADMHAINATGGQLFEGYQYLGAGLLGLLLAVLVRRRGRAWLVAGAGRHAGLLLAMAALTAYAVTGHVTLMRHTLLHLHVVPPGGGLFRASGRLFWPVAYVLLLAGVRGVSVAWPRAGLVAWPRAGLVAWPRAGTVMWPRAGDALLLAAAALQLFDVSTMRMHVHDAKFLDQQGLDASSAALDAVLAQSRSVTLLPRVECDAAALDIAMPVIFLAARRDLPVNTMYAARVETANRCDPAAEVGLRRALPPGALGVTYGATRDVQAATWRRGGMACAGLAALTLCAAGGSALASLAATPPLSPLPPGETVTAARRQLFADGLASGWGPAEDWGAWAVTPHPLLELHVRPSDAPLRVTLGLRAPPGIGAREIAVRAGGEAARVVATATLGQRDSLTGFVLAPGAARAGSGGVITLELDAGPTVTIPDVPRRFGVGLVSVAVTPEAAP